MVQLNLQTSINKMAWMITLCIASTSSHAINHNDGQMNYEDISAKAIKILGFNKTIIGQEFNYPSGTPLINAYNIEIAPGKQTDIHQHLVPLYIYVASGELEVDYGSKGKRTIHAGTSYIEAINWCHVGKSTGKETVKIIGVYLGQIKPNQINPEACTKLQ